MICYTINDASISQGLRIVMSYSGNAGRRETAGERGFENLLDDDRDESLGRDKQPLGGAKAS